LRGVFLDSFLKEEKMNDMMGIAIAYNDAVAEKNGVKGKGDSRVRLMEVLANTPDDVLEKFLSVVKKKQGESTE